MNPACCCEEHDCPVCGELPKNEDQDDWEQYVPDITENEEECP